MFRTVFSSIIRSSRLYIQQQVYVALKLPMNVKYIHELLCYYGMKRGVCYQLTVGLSKGEPVCFVT
jgi:hypothetical protein